MTTPLHPSDRTEPTAAAHAPAGTIVFAHANGFPAATYGVLFDAWRAAGWRVLAPAKFGHDPHYPVSGNWPRLRDELIHYIEREAGGAPVQLVGHSLGGYLSLLAASRRPDLAAGVVLLDSPLVAGWKAHGLRVAKLTGLMRRVSPAQGSHKRRTHWASAQDAQAHFAGKRAFQRWDPRLLHDYAHRATEPDPHRGGVRLAFRREVETRIYLTVPHHLPALLRRHPPHCPIAYLGGTRSHEGRQIGLAATQALTHGRAGWIEGSHLFPMEQPEATARAVLELIGTSRD